MFALAAGAFATAVACSAPDPGVGGINRVNGGGNSSGSGSGGTTSGGSSGGSSGAGSSSSGGGGGDASTTNGNMTLTDGTMMSGPLVIAATDTVTIAPGAAITLPAMATITIQGTLTASSSMGTHAKLTGAGWGGIIVAAGGVLSLDGVDITGATTALDVQANDTKAEYDNATITGAKTPFQVAANGKLGTAHATVTGTMGGSTVSGSLTATFLDYDSNGNEGITTNDAGAVLSIDDSKLHGTGPSGDMIVSGTGAKSIHVGYTSITNVHCGFHFNTIDAFDVSYTNVEGNAYGFMLYGSSGPGPRSVTYSNIDTNTNFAFDTQGSNGPITFDNDYVTGQTSGTSDTGGPVTVTNQQNAMVTGTGPR